MSKKKQAKMEQAHRVEKINARSLNGKGYFMDAHYDDLARTYIATGDEAILDRLPDYRDIRKQNAR